MRGPPSLRKALTAKYCLLLGVPLLSGCSSPLVRAARDGQAEQVRVLLPTEKKRCGDALRAAAANNREPAVKALLDGGCDVNAKDKDGYTPLMMAAAKGHDDVIRLLLMRKADADLVTWNDKTAAMLATENRHKDTARLIENLDRSLNPEVAAMVAASPPASGGFLDSVLDAAASGAAQSMIHQAASGKMPDMNMVAQGALRGALNGEAAGSSQGLLNAAAGGAMGGAMRNLGKSPQSMLRAAATGAAVEAAGSLLIESTPAAPMEEQQAPSPSSSEERRVSAAPIRAYAGKGPGLQDALAGAPKRLAGDVAKVDELAPVAAQPESFINSLIAIRVKDSDAGEIANGVGWMKATNASGYFVGFGDGRGWKDSLAPTLSNPRQGVPAGFLLFNASDGGKGALWLDDEQWRHARIFLARVMGNALMDATNGGRGLPAGGLYLRPVALVDPQGDWRVVDESYVSHDEWSKAVLLATQYRYELANPGLKVELRAARKLYERSPNEKNKAKVARLMRQAKSGTLGDYVGVSHEALAAELRARQDRAHAAQREKGLGDLALAKTQTFQGWWVDRNQDGTFLVTRLEGTYDAAFGGRSNRHMLQLDVDLAHNGVRAHDMMTKSALPPSESASTADGWQIVAQPKGEAPARSRNKDCATLTKIMASKDDITARHGAIKATQVIVAARKKFVEFKCAR